MNTRRNTEVKPRRVRKLWHKGLASLPLLDGKRRREQDLIDLIPVGRNTGFDLHEDRLVELARIFGDEGLARRVLDLQKKRYPYATVPELVCLEFLERNHEKYTYQAQVLGGWRGGGLVPDFAVLRGGSYIALLIQGIYWHNVPGKREKDNSDKLRMLGTLYEGRPISHVVFVWENRLMTTNPARERVLEDAVVGVETGQ